ncbi:MAG: fasciclin domain-containing protein [Candidatus Sumerlaeia bacterium]|nr:fasciclin domain-containing protein [Candidatus Sumerlaeia bacterium]
MNFVNKSFTLAAVAVLALVTSTQAHDHGAKPATQAASKPAASAPAAAQGTIVETAVAAGSFNTLVAAVKAADLVDTLNGEGPFTVFAPTDEAFAKLPAGTVEDLLKPENKAKLQAILTYHVVPGKVTSDKVAKLDVAKTVQGQRVDIKVMNGVNVDSAKVIKADVLASNGVIHVIDSVILPETKNVVEVAQGAGTFNTLIAAATAAGLAETLATTPNITVFAPTDEAFAKLPAGTVEDLLKPENKEKLQAILKLHVVQGNIYAKDALKSGNATALSGGKLNITAEGAKPKVNGAGITATDIEAFNGVIHVIDTVILPE